MLMMTGGSVSKNSAPRVLLVLLMASISERMTPTAKASTITSLMQSVGSCEMNCENGYCEYVGGDQNTHQLMYQSGRMLQRCVCFDGWTGTGCELEVQQCDATGKCTNGQACDNGSCDCATADALSTVASRQCRNPYTEYCSSAYDPNVELSFCTNGGVCRGSLMAAEVAPGNTSVNALYEHEGCICPREYYGPHCEFIHHTLPPPTSSTSSSTIVEHERLQAPPPVSSSSTTNPASDQTSSQSIEDLIRGYNEFGGNPATAGGSPADSDGSGSDSNESHSGSNNEKMSPVRKFLLGLLLGIFGIGCVLVGVQLMRRYRRRRGTIKTQEKRRRRRWRQQLKKKVGQFLPKNKDEPELGTVSKNKKKTKMMTNANRNHKKTKNKKQANKVHKKRSSDLPVHQGSADLSPFVVDDDSSDDDFTSMTSSSRSSDHHHQEGDMGSSNNASGGWVAALNRLLDTYVGTGTGPTPTTANISGRRGPNEDEGAAYMVDDDDDEEVLVADLGYMKGHHGLSPSSSSLLRHAAAYVVDDDQDIYTVEDDEDDDDGNLYYYHGNNAGLEPPTTTASWSLWGDAPLFQ